MPIQTQAAQIFPPMDKVKAHVAEAFGNELEQVEALLKPVVGEPTDDEEVKSLATRVMQWSRIDPKLAAAILRPYAESHLSVLQEQGVDFAKLQKRIEAIVGVTDGTLTPTESPIGGIIGPKLRNVPIE